MRKKIRFNETTQQEGEDWVLEKILKELPRLPRAEIENKHLLGMRIRSRVIDFIRSRVSRKNLPAWLKLYGNDLATSLYYWYCRENQSSRQLYRNIALEYAELPQDEVSRIAGRMKEEQICRDSATAPADHLNEEYSDQLSNQDDPEQQIEGHQSLQTFCRLILNSESFARDIVEYWQPLRAAIDLSNDELLVLRMRQQFTWPEIEKCVKSPRYKEQQALDKIRRGFELAGLSLDDMN